MHSGLFETGHASRLSSLSSKERTKSRPWSRARGSHRWRWAERVPGALWCRVLALPKPAHRPAGGRRGLWGWEIKSCSSGTGTQQPTTHPQHPRKAAGGERLGQLPDTRHRQTLSFWSKAIGVTKLAQPRPSREPRKEVFLPKMSHMQRSGHPAHADHTGSFPSTLSAPGRAHAGAAYAGAPQAVGSQAVGSPAAADTNPGSVGSSAPAHAVQ